MISIRLLLLFFAAFISGCATQTAPLRTVQHVDLKRYMGDWRVISNIPYFAEKGRVDSVESYALRPDGRPMLFQDTASAGSGLTPFFFDLLHVDDLDLVDEPTTVRFERLARLVPLELLVDRLVTSDPEEASRFSEQVLASGHEGVVLKALDASYAAGRRGASWVKVKPVHTLDLVVLAVEWGSGRRRGWLSNIHLGARTDDGGFVMLGKTFKGMTDQMLAWQTERFLELETHRDGHVVFVRPEQVVDPRVELAPAHD